MMASAACLPWSRLPPPVRASAWSMFSTVRTPNAHGTPVRSWTSWIPRAARVGVGQPARLAQAHRGRRGVRQRDASIAVAAGVVERCGLVGRAGTRSSGYPPVMESGVVVSIALLTVVHFAAFGLLFWHLAGREILSTFRIEPDGGRGGGSADAPPPDTGGDRDGGVPLPDASPAPVRLREPGRIADGYPRRERRPAREPEPAPQRAPVASS